MNTSATARMHLYLRPSKILLYATLLIGLAFWLISFQLELPYNLQLPLACLQTATLFFNAKKWILLRYPSSPAELVLYRQKFELIQQDGTQHEATLAPSSLITPTLSILILHTKSRFFPHTIFFTTDNCHREQHRRLRVYLKLRGRKHVRNQSH